MAKTVDVHRRLRVALRQRRKALDLSLSEVAQMTGIGASRIRRIEQDADNSPRLIQIARLARLYGFEADEIFALVDIPERISAASQPPEPPSATSDSDSDSDGEVDEDAEL